MEYEYRKIWNIPRHDPRLENMTPEEFEFEVITDIQHWRRMKDQPPLTSDHETWKEDAQKELQEIVKREQEQAKAKAETIEKIEPEEAFKRA